MRDAIAIVTGTPADQVEPHVRPSSDPKFGDYQCNAAMTLAKALSMKPRDVAQKIIDAAKLEDIATAPEIAGPGFINIQLKDDFLARALEAIPPADKASNGALTDARFAPADRCGIPPVPVSLRETVVIDYSSPNIAKQMHVGHLRTTIIGDVISRVLEFAGHRVIRQNHLGDWGTAIGAVITGLWYIRTRVARGESLEQVQVRMREALSLREAPVETRRTWLAPLAREWTTDLHENDIEKKNAGTTLDELELGYVFVQTLAALARGTGVEVGADDQARQLEDIPRLTTTFLQRGDAYELEEWRQASEISIAACQRIYEQLGVLLRPEDVYGESQFNDRLAQTVDDIRRILATPTGGEIKAVCREDNGALCIFLEHADGSPAFKNPDGDPLPMIIQKSDGAYLYSTTDLAAIRYRANDLNGTRLIYVVGAPQRLHFQMLFAAARALGWIPKTTKLEHVSFGSVLGENKRPLKTRDGDNVKLQDLLDEAERRARALIDSRDSDSADAAQLSEVEKAEVARRVGIASVKYFDLLRERNNDYVFDWDQMLSFQGNTAPYMMYAYARIRSIYRKAVDAKGAGTAEHAESAILLADPHERALALRILRLSDAVSAVANDLQPHVLCTYLYALASDFMRFYENCSVIDAPSDAARQSRLRLCDITARSLKLGLSLLGIEVAERM
ncbi:MAG: arginine--tRNA ligase [Phycisphaerae bacterium]